MLHHGIFDMKSGAKKALNAPTTPRTSFHHAEISAGAFTVRLKPPFHSLVAYEFHDVQSRLPRVQFQCHFIHGLRHGFCRPRTSKSKSRTLVSP